MKGEIIMHTIRYYFMLIIAFIAISCQSSEQVVEKPSATTPLPPTSIPTFTATWTQTSTLAPTLTATTTLIPTFTLTPIPTASNTPRPTATPSLTPLPTLDPDAATTLVLELLDNNGGCRLPCWWGATPGQTRWDDIGPFFRSFALDWFSSHDYLRAKSSYEVLYSFPGAINDQLHIFFATDKGIFDQAWIYLGDSQNYSLASILTTYGQPEEVWVTGKRPLSPDEELLNMNVLLLYSQQGFAIAYSDEEFLDGENVYSCFYEIQYPRFPILWLWTPSSDVATLNEARDKKYISDNYPYYVPLAEVTDYDVATFYEIFKNPTHTECLETPANRWPTTFGWPDGTPTPTPTP
jgi:hypothetical protein